MTTAPKPGFIEFLRKRSNIPVVLFPGSVGQIDGSADTFLLLSLISGRNPELLIGKHVEAAPLLKASELEVVPVGYMLIDGGSPTTASYVSQSSPIPFDKPGIAAMTALAGEMLGLKIIFLDAGSGARRPVPQAIITGVREEVQLPIIVGGGIDSPEKAFSAASAGANLVVAGNALEQDPALLPEMIAAVRSAGAAAAVSN
jgi:putative glycerol-1-phosphate prenyltransferase